MRVLVNGTSIGSMSGRHVLYGHLRQLAQGSADSHEFVVLRNPGESCPKSLELPNVSWIEAPAAARHWATRSLWESWELPRIIRRQGIDRYFTPSGTGLPRCPVPQMSLAQNPWPLVREIHRSASERFKARLQRWAFRQAFRAVDVMAYNSEHMRSQYTRNAPGVQPGRSLIAFQGIDDDVHDAGAAAERTIERTPLTVVAVSAMAHWKGADTLVAAIKRLRDRGVPALARLVGPWPDPSYEAKVRRSVDDLQLQSAVVITGAVSREQLHREYATARVFCLTSGCESFGIPAVEAQAFGTPVVGSSTTAMAEIGGAGGVFGPHGDPGWTADALEPLLTDDAQWSHLSRRARENANRFRWSECSKPLFSFLDRESAVETSNPRRPQLAGDV